MQAWPTDPATRDRGRHGVPAHGAHRCRHEVRKRDSRLRPVGVRPEPSSARPILTVDVYTPDQYPGQRELRQWGYDIQNANDARRRPHHRAGHPGWLLRRRWTSSPQAEGVGGARGDGPADHLPPQAERFLFQPIRKATIDETDVLPYASVKYDINEKNVLRLSGSQTISRPGFREMAPSSTPEYFAGVKNVGNPELQNGRPT